MSYESDKACIAVQKEIEKQLEPLSDENRTSAVIQIGTNVSRMMTSLINKAEGSVA